MPGLHDDAALHHLQQIVDTSTSNVAPWARDWLHQLARKKVIDQGTDSVFGTVDTISTTAGAAAAVIGSSLAGMWEWGRSGFG